MPTDNFQNFADLQAASLELASALTKEIGRVLSTSSHILLMLPGGTTPIPLFSALSNAPLPWEKVIVSLSDERFVENTSSDSNEKLVSDHLLCHINPKPLLIPLVTNLADSQTNLTMAEDRIKPYIDFPEVTVLGMGVDGHIASLFTEDDVKHQGIYCETLAPNGKKRMSLTLPQILKSERIFLLISGKDKKHVYEKALSYYDNSPISHLIRLAGDKIVVYCAA